MATNVGNKVSQSGGNGDDEGKHKPLTEKLIVEILRYFAGLTRGQMEGYTFTQHSSDYAHAHSDFDIYDKIGGLVFHGRSFGGDVTAFWRPMGTTTTPQWATSAKP